MPRKKGTIQSFTVEGATMFPLDMLRFDGCFPATAYDSDRLRWAVVGPRNDRQIALISTTGHVTVDRWWSFGYRVIKVNGGADPAHYDL